MSLLRTARRIWPVDVALVSAALSVLLGGLLPGSAGAVIQKAVTIDGPSPEIESFGGVAMAPDGSGGVVYLKRVGGVSHVFVAQYKGGKWLAPVEVDSEATYAASDPRIGAANGGELIVLWATPFASVNEKTIFRLVSAELAPGSQAFAPPVIVDRNIGEADEVSPDLAMSGGGSAYVVYRVLRPQAQRSSVPLLKPGDVLEEVRVARLNGERWVDLGEINHDPGISMRPPTSANAPRIALGSSTTAVVVWQEPEVNGTARIWARRLFGTNIDYPMLVSATSYRGAPLAYDSDAPRVAFSSLGQAEVAYRQLSGPGSPLSGPRIFLNVLPDGEAESGYAFLGASVVDPELAGGEAAEVGRPSVDIDAHDAARLLYDADGAARVVEADNNELSSPFDLRPAFVGTQLTPANELEPVSVINPGGGTVSAWPSADTSGAPALAVEEAFPDGAVQTALLSAPAGGPIAALGAGRSGLGDALVAFQQGPVGSAAIVGARVSAPPASFAASVPHGWIQPSQARVEWSASASADGPLSYFAVLDGHRLPVPVGAQEMALPGQLPDGIHHVQMLVVDAEGQSALTAPVELDIGPPPPVVAIGSADGGRGVVVRVNAPRSARVGSVSIDFGDGQHASSQTYVRHIYARAGRYVVVVDAGGSDGANTRVRRVVRAR